MWGYLGIAAAAFAAGAAGAWQVHGWKAAAEQAEVASINHEAANERYWDQRFRAEGVDRNVQKRLRAADAAADGARSELEQLRAELEVDVATGEPAVCARVAERAAIASRLLGECGGRYAAVARDAQKYAEQLRGWQALIPDDAPPDD